MYKTFYGIFFTILTLNLIQSTISQNLICNGDFEGHNFRVSYWNEPYVYINSNNTCWFNKNGGQIEIKKKIKPPVGATAQLSLTSAYILCQYIVMEIGSNYQLNFTVVNGWTMSYSTIIVTVDNIWIKNLTALNQFTIAKGSVVFTASTKLGKLCFDPRFKIVNTISYGYIGPCIDNVTLIKLPTPPANNTSNNTTNSSNSSISNTTSQNSTASASTSTNTSSPSSPIYPSIPNNTNVTTFNQIIFYIYCVTNRQEREEIVIADCKYQDDRIQYLIASVQDLIQLYIEDQLQNQAELTEIKATSLKFIVTPNRSYNLKKFAIVLPDQIIKNTLGIPYRFVFYVDSYNLAFSVLNTEQIDVVMSMYPISEFVMDTLQKIYSVLRASFFSYFLVDIISFWNLSIMYNFLNIKTVPLFSKYFLQRLQTILFRLGSIMQWVSGKIPQLKQLLDFSSIQGRELIVSYQYKFAWFGYFGISSGYMSSNVEQVVVIVLLIFKLGIITVIRRIRFLPKIFRKQLPGKHKKIQIFLNELIGMHVFMIVSAAGSLCFFGFEVSKEKMNTLVQVITLFQGIIVLPLYFLNQISSSRKKYKKKLLHRIQQLQQKSQKNINQIILNLKIERKKQFITSVHNFLQFIPFVTIPFLIVFDNSALFLIVHTFVFGLRLWWVWKYLGVFSEGRVEKVFLVLNLGIWLVHHFVYMIFWVLETLAVANQQTHYSGEAFQCIKICGFITIFTVICGGLLELLRFIVSILFFLFKGVKKICGKFTKIHDQQILRKQEQKNKSLKAGVNNKKELAVVKAYDDRRESDKMIQQLNWNRFKVRVHFKKQRDRIPSNMNAANPKKKKGVKKQKS